MDINCFLEALRPLHDHICPRQVLGLRIGMYAASLLNVPLPQTDKRVFCFVETDGCFVDGITVTTGCSFGHRTMRLMDYGKVAATFVDAVSGQAVRILPQPTARERAKHYARDATDSWHAQLAGYQIMPTTELLCAGSVELTGSLQAIISQPGMRATCAICGEEIMNQREVMRGGETICIPCAREGYCRVAT
jgi:formylmethanofuran dehydrogenase subunit E